MRIAIVCESFLPRTNGVVNSIKHISSLLVQAGHQVILVVPDSYREPSWNGIMVHRVKSFEIPGVHDMDIAWTTPGKLAQVFDDFGADVVHLASPFVLGRQAGVAARMLGIPVVAVFQTDVPGYASQYGLGPVTQLAHAVVRSIHSQATTNLAPSQASKTYLAALGVPRVTIWRRGVNRTLFRPEFRSSELRASWHATYLPVVGVVGRLAPEKNIAILAGLATRADLRLVIVGDGPERAHLQRLLPRAIFMGRLAGNDLGAAMASMDVLVAPGELETFCQVVQEGQSAGVPVVAPAIGGPVDLIDDQITGLLYQPGDVLGMEQAVDRLLDDELFAHRVREQALAAVADRDWGTLTQELIGHYSAACAGLLGLQAA